MMKIKKISATLLIAFSLATVSSAQSLACESANNSATTQEVSKLENSSKNLNKEIAQNNVNIPKRDRAP